MARLTKRIIDAATLQPGEGERFIWDDELPGFGLRLLPSGRKSYVVQYKAGGRGGKTRRQSLGLHGPMTPEQARTAARRILGQRAQGDDPIAATRERAAEEAPPSLADILDRYKADLLTRGGDAGNVGRVRAHLTPRLASKPATEIAEADLRGWRDDLAAKLAPATVNRTANAIKAALNLAADLDKRIVSRRAWEIGLASLPGAERSRNVILSDADVRRLVAAAYETGEAFGLLVEVAAVTGARYSQIAQLECRDLQDGDTPRLMMPSSAKGRGKRQVRRPVPIPKGLAKRLAARMADRAADAPLLTKTSDEPWRKSDHSRPFARIVKRCNLDPEVTIYALRHSSIVRQIKANVPLRIIAVSHDTSVAMIERHYSAEIADFADDISRAAMLTTEAEIVPLPQRIG